jgi:hypothetical protein
MAHKQVVCAPFFQDDYCIEPLQEVDSATSDRFISCWNFEYSALPGVLLRPVYITFSTALAQILKNAFPKPINLINEL